MKAKQLYEQMGFNAAVVAQLMSILMTLRNYHRVSFALHGRPQKSVDAVEKLLYLRAKELAEYDLRDEGIARVWTKIQEQCKNSQSVDNVSNVGKDG